MNQMPPTHSQSLAIQQLQQQQQQQHQQQQQQQLQQPQKQMQLPNGLPSNSTSGNWYGMNSGHHGPPQSMGVSRNFASNATGLPDSYVMTSAGGAGGRNMVPYYEGTTMQKMPPNHMAPEYNRPAMMSGHVTQNGYLPNGMMQKGFGQNEMMLDPSVAMPTHTMMSGVGSRPMQVISPNVDYYQEQRMAAGCRPMYSQQFDPCLPGQGPMMEAVRTPMGPSMTTGPEMTPDVMICRDATRGSLPQQHNMMGYQNASQRIMPYPNPQQYMQNKRAQYSVRRKMYDYDPAMQQYNNGCYGGGWPRQSLPSQPMVSPGYPNMGGVPCHVKEEPDPYLQMAVPLPNQCQPQMWQSNREPLQRSNAFSPPPGNPTPPMTPGSTSMPCNILEPSDVRPNGLRPFRENELSFTFPVRDGMVKAPFQLEHNAPVSCHIFNLNDQVHESLMARPELELMLKCFHKEDRTVATNWPTTVSISLNEVPLMIDRGSTQMSPHQPMFLKSICKPGQNTLQISVTTCCCSHLFVLQVVHRPSIRSIFQGLTMKRLLPASTTIGKIKRLLSQMSMMPPALANEQQTMSLPLTCPLSMQRIVLPSRGRDCQHIECFDLETYLKLNCQRNHWQCPWCKKMAALDGLEVDQFIWGILDHPASTCSDAVLLDISANWKPLPKTGAEFGSEALPNLYKKFVLVNTMHFPSPGSYSTGKAPMANGMTMPPGSSLCHPKEMTHQERLQKPAPVEAPNYLGCLSQMTDVFLGPDASPSVAPQTNGMEHVSFPPTPMGSQISQICTPLDGQSLHPRTPSEGHATHPHTPPDGHPFTPLDSQSLYGKTPPENHGVAGISTQTPSAAFDLCGSSKRGTSTTAEGNCLPATVTSCSGSNAEGGKSESAKQDQLGVASRGGPSEPENPLITEDLTKLDFKSNLSLYDDNQDMISLLPDSFDYDLSDLTCYLGSGTKTVANKSMSKDVDDDFLSFLN